MRLSRSSARSAVVVVAVAAGILVPPPAVAGAAAVDARQAAYVGAATAYGVPERILLAVSYLESRWDTNDGRPSTAGGYGPMHLTDPVAAGPGSAAGGGSPGGAQPAGDTRGDSARPLAPQPPPATGGSGKQITTGTLAVAAALTGADPASLRRDPAVNIRGGAALLARYQRDLGGRTGWSTDPGGWYAAVARYPGAAEPAAARAFADEVYTVLATGAARTTDDGHPLRLAPGAAKIPTAAASAGAATAGASAGATAGASAVAECPTGLACGWVPAPYRLLGNGGDQGNYGNHDLGSRPTQQKIEYIVVHDTEGGFGSTVSAVQNPAYVSWHYTIRSSDGYVVQHVPTRDVAWQAGNWYVNAKSVGIEHEGYAAAGTWYTEAMYRASAKLVRYLATRFGIPLDRAHVLGHDNVPGITPAYVAGMHWDPGPYWDWARYLSLLGAPLVATGTAASGLVTIRPAYATNRPAYQGCGSGTASCPPRGSSEVVLRRDPRADAPLVVDAGLHPDGSPSTMRVSDTGARASTGQRYAVAGRSGSWTAIWYLGQKAWFYDPPSSPTAVPASGLVVTPKPGRAWIPVYGRAYPERGAYPAGVEVQPVVALQYRLPAGQRYSAAASQLPATLPSEYYHAVTFGGSAPRDRTVVRGSSQYVQIQFGHRIMYVDAADVQILRA